MTSKPERAGGQSDIALMVTRYFSNPDLIGPHPKVGLTTPARSVVSFGSGVLGQFFWGPPFLQVLSPDA